MILSRQGSSSVSGGSSTPAGSGAAKGGSKGQLPLDCECFLRSNYYVEEVNGTVLRRHFEFKDELSFREAHAALLETLAAETQEALVAKIVEENARRLGMDDKARWRKQVGADCSLVRVC